MLIVARTPSIDISTLPYFLKSFKIMVFKTRLLETFLKKYGSQEMSEILNSIMRRRGCMLFVAMYCYYSSSMVVKVVCVLCAAELVLEIRYALEYSTLLLEHSTGVRFMPHA